VGAVVAFAGQLGGPIPSKASPPAPLTTSPHETVQIEAWGWMLCDGRSLDVEQYPELFAA
jgi:hypothetical protein